ncbi:hypothetical protein [Pontibacter anaerobius]|uniref:Uncharacterized protein n=1 Tax=Pontibacter anaerobius TaxID=2993940 RepID=A0ABT3RI39_9BACT|nr:hypothetical protein [Pontibacter anaerobius]MCX2741470.1 hypothetical protein [Pontibacter anaerobius]
MKLDAKLKESMLLIEPYLYRDHFAAFHPEFGLILYTFAAHLKDRWAKLPYFIFWIEENPSTQFSFSGGCLDYPNISNPLFYYDEWNQLKKSSLSDLTTLHSRGSFCAAKQMDLEMEGLRLSQSVPKEKMQLLERDIRFNQIISDNAAKLLTFRNAQPSSELYVMMTYLHEVLGGCSSEEVVDVIEAFLEDSTFSEDAYITPGLKIFEENISRFTNSTVNERGIASFTWLDLSHFDKQVSRFHQELIDNGYIGEETLLEDFKKAFNGSMLSSPLNIRYIKETPNGGHTSKASLLYLLHRLGEVGLVVKKDVLFGEAKASRDAYAARIEKVFVNFKGKPLAYLVKSRIDKRDPITNKRYVEPPVDRDSIESMIEAVQNA